VIVLLDAGPLAMVTHPRATEDNERCRKWLESLLDEGTDVVVPEIADYELRRELLRAERTEGLRRLDELGRRLRYSPITTEIMRTAATYWAIARRRGQPTAPDPSLDPDVILAAQAAAEQARRPATQVLVATTNVGHLARFADARQWWEIP
jgi:predicted nucleic acid-binding protein